MQLETGSFRDRNNQVFYHSGTVYRGISEQAWANWQQLVNEPFYTALSAAGKTIGTEVAPAGEVPETGWAATLKHERIPYVSYPYEWSFGMLKEAALLHLDILEEAIPNGWTLKDSSAYNVQWRGHRSTFIDTTSFEPYVAGTPWLGYRQFCMMFFNPLILKAYKDFNYLPLLRANLEGIDPAETAKLFGVTEARRKGVMFHVFMHARLQQKSAQSEIKNVAIEDDDSAKKGPRHSEAMVVGTLQSMRRVVKSLSIQQQLTTWSDYDKTHSYQDDTFEHKQAFVEKHAAQRHWPMVWDIGCNTGTFSKICSPHADYVVAMDGDTMAIETLYNRLQNEQFTKYPAAGHGPCQSVPGPGLDGTRAKNRRTARNTGSAALSGADPSHGDLGKHTDAKLYRMGAQSGQCGHSGICRTGR